MFLLTRAVVLVALSFLIHQNSYAGKNGHRIGPSNYAFSEAEKRCLNARGETGYNLNKIGPCGDLSEINLRKGSIRNRLQRKNLILKGSILANADLRNTHFKSADLSYADLRGANLGGVIFERVSLVGADLRGADLSGAVFIGALHSEKSRKQSFQLSGALFDDETVLSTLTQTESGESSVSERAFALSKGMIRMILRPETDLDYEIEGGKLTILQWDNESGKGLAELNTPSHSTFLKIPNEKVHRQIEKITSKSRVFIKDYSTGSQLVQAEPAEE